MAISFSFPYFHIFYTSVIFILSLSIFHCPPLSPSTPSPSPSSSSSSSPKSLSVVVDHSPIVFTPPPLYVSNGFPSLGIQIDFISECFEYFGTIESDKVNKWKFLESLQSTTLSSTSPLDICLSSSSSLFSPLSFRYSVLKSHLYSHSFYPKIQTFSTLFFQHSQYVQNSQDYETLKGQLDHLESLVRCDMVAFNDFIGMKCLQSDEEQSHFVAKSLELFSSSSSHSFSSVYSDILEFDHFYSSSSSQSQSDSSLPLIIVYSHLHSKSFSHFHRKLVAAAEKGTIRYVLRPKSPLCRDNSSMAYSSSISPSSLPSPYRFGDFPLCSPFHLNGYGIELQLKNMEYKVLDDSTIQYDADESNQMDIIDKKMGGNDDDSDDDEHSVDDELQSLSSSPEKKSSSSSSSFDFRDLGYQSSQRLISSHDPLAMLREISQNFPMYANALANTPLNKTLKSGILQQQQGATSPMGMSGGITRGSLPPPGSNLLLINGFSFPLDNSNDDFDYFHLLQFLHEESSFSDDFGHLHFKSSSLSPYFTISTPSTAADDTNYYQLQMMGIPLPESDFTLNMKLNDPQSKLVITWLNDIAKDKKYQQWGESVMEYLQPSWPNQLKYVRKNMYSAVIVIDPSKKNGLDYYSQAQVFVKGFAPCRFGIVFDVENQEEKGKGKGNNKVWDDNLLPSANYSSFLSSDINIIDSSSSSSSSSSSPSSSSSFSTSYRIAAQFRYLLTEANKDSAFEYLQRLADLHDDIDDKDADESFISIGKSKKKIKEKFSSPSEFINEILHSEETKSYIFSSQKYLSSRRLPVGHPYPIIITNGIPHYGSSAKQFRDTMMEGVYLEQSKVGIKVYNGEITDRTDIAEYWQGKPFCFSALGNHILQKDSDIQFVKELPPIILASSASAIHPIFYLYSGSAEREFNVRPLTYWVVADWTTDDGISIVEAAMRHLDRKQEESGPIMDSRVSFIFHPKGFSNHNIRIIAFVVHSLLSLNDQIKGKVLLNQFIQIVKTVNPHDSTHKNLLAAIRLWMGSHNKMKKFISQLDQIITLSSTITWSELNPSFETNYIVNMIPAGEVAVIANGRVISPPQHLPSSSYSVDFQLLEEFEWKYGRAEGLKATFDSFPPDKQFDVDTLNSDDLTVDFYSDILMRLAFLLRKRENYFAKNPIGKSAMEQGHWPPFDEKKHTAIIHYDSPSTPSVGNSPVLSIQVVLDPLSKASQKVSSILLSLREQFRVSMTVVLNPRQDLREFPLKRFYRYCVPKEPKMDSNHRVVPSRGVSFRNLRSKHVLTMGISTPEPWVVGLANSGGYDLDNLRLSDISISHVPIIYSLESLLVSGQMFDVVKSEPAAGIQVRMTHTFHTEVDSIVMQNLGYWQLKSHCGISHLQFVDKHSEIYEIDREFYDKEKVKQRKISSAAGGSSNAFGMANNDFPTRHFHYESDGSISVFFSILSWTDPITHLFVKRRRGQEQTNLLEANTQKKGKGLLEKLLSFGNGDDSGNSVDSDATALTLPPHSQMFYSAAKSRGVDFTLDTLHVFSLASGHLYERFLKIMMLSVIKNTKNPVKFWFLRNFASPQFVSFVPQMALSYGFEVEFVTYKWPLWLRRQEEKQRVIWGYKILFLDVLFPLSVQRVVYIDADQVVRADISELFTLDLQGAPYAYTPFCDSNKDTEGFRFWKQGYWKEHLKGKSYHISALYVVDLKTFRTIRAGDQLRATYDQLSADPNSLSNLDQDLPNHMQHVLPIHSLPMEWLFCATWCDRGELQRAKSIDLCNNPLTKQPKLEAAKEIIKEWTELDEEAKRVETHSDGGMDNKGKQHTDTQKDKEKKKEKEEL